ncbi:hypothetical protein IIC65_09210, partial [Candidatus Sumerlaeota bacterium]|nr:hypothetical protein [Candidatus Sumerlaeota bacterium]
HRVEVTQPRSYSSWIVFNLWDTVVFLGFPLAVFWICKATSSVASIVRRAEFSGASAAALSCAAATAGLLLIDLTGTVRGEAGRIWIPIMPFLLISALATQSPHAMANGKQCDETAGIRVLARPGLVFVLLIACCLVLRRTWNLP